MDLQAACTDTWSGWFAIGLHRVVQSHSIIAVVCFLSSAPMTALFPSPQKVPAPMAGFADRGTA